MKERETRDKSIDFEQEPEGIKHENSITNILNKLKSEYPELFSVQDMEKEMSSQEITETHEVDELVDESSK